MNRPAFDPKTEGIFEWAKRSAVAARRDRLAVSDLLCGIYALARDGQLAPEVLGPLARPPEEWPEATGNAHAAAYLIRVEEVRARRLPFDDVLRKVIEAAHAVDPTMPPGVLVQALLRSEDPLVRQWLGPGPVSEVTPAAASEEAGAAGSPPPPTSVEVLRVVTDRAARLTASLRQRVLGQEMAIAMLADGFFRASLRPPGIGPRGIFTFLGPPGVGKTLLAETFGQALGEAEEKDPYHFRRFDMGSFSAPQNHEQLFGAETFYRGSRTGSLTGFVAEKKRAVVLFDEIEKAHENTLQALLAVLDKGEVVDKQTGSPVSFAETWFVFTSNLGRELFGSDNEWGFLRRGALSSAAVFDLLATARARREVGVKDAPPAMPPEFISRLSKGAAVVFNHLETHHYLQLIESGVASRAAGSAAPAVRADQEARLLFLLSLLPEVDARSAGSRSEAWAAEIVRRSFEECRPELLASGLSSYEVAITCGPSARSYLEAQGREVETRLLLVDDNDYFPALIERECAALRPTVRRVGLGDDVLQVLQRFEADLVLLDLSIGESGTSPRVDTALGLLETLRSRLPALPVYLFSENPEARQSFEHVVSQVMQRGGARGFLPCRRDPGSDVLVDDFLAQVREVAEEARYAAVIRRKQRARQRVSFDLRFRLEAETGRIVVEIQAPREEVAVKAEDRAAAIRFSGIPRERFADVAGLDRAKRRLGQVLRWLKQPGTLGAFGVRPPTGFLLAGPPGTGKTLLARALAGEAELPFLALSAGELKSKWAGESEERIRDLFAMARRYAPAIVFVDEIDAIGGVRGRSPESPWRDELLNELLARMDGHRSADRPIFVLGATNRPEDLDPALRRPGRFDETIPIDLPNARARREFFERRLGSVAHEAPLALERLLGGTAGCTPAQLDRIVREAVYLAAAEGRPAIGAADLEAARRLVRFGAVKEDVEIRPEELRLTARHEAAHALVHAVLFPERPIDYVTIVPSESGALGFVAPLRDETRLDVRREDVRRQMAVYLAGREAELLAGGAEDALTAGASSDLRNATSLAYRAIAEWGFDEEFGLASLAGMPDGSRGAFEARLLERLPGWLAQGREVARRILEERRPALDALTEALLAKESLHGEELQDVLSIAPRP